MQIAIISSSLNKKSNSLILSNYAYSYLKNKGSEAILINMQDYTLPLCCADSAYKHEHVKTIKDILYATDSILISTPIYNYEVNAVLKNMLDLTGDSWKEKIIGMMCTAGGSKSYMALMSFANSLMLNFRCLILPKFVYANDKAFDTDQRLITDSEIKLRVNELCDKLLEITLKLN